MSQVRESLPGLVLGKGATLRFFTDPSQPEVSHRRKYTAAHYDGQATSWVPDIPPHWHAEHTEYVRVVKGRLTCSLDGVERVLSAGDEEVEILPGVVHGFRFFPGEETVVHEMSDPAGDYKEHFFRDLLQTGEMRPALMMRAAVDGDMFAHIPYAPKFLDRAFTLCLGTLFRPFVPGKPPMPVREEAEGGGVS